MCMVGHHYVGVQLIPAEFRLAVMNGLDYQFRDFWLPQEVCAGGALVEKTIERYESLA